MVVEKSWRTDDPDQDLETVYESFESFSEDSKKYFKRTSPETIGANVAEAAKDNSNGSDLNVMQRADVLFWLAENSLSREKQFLEMRSSVKDTIWDTLRGQVYLMTQRGNFQVNGEEANATIQQALRDISENFSTIHLQTLSPGREQLRNWVKKKFRSHQDINKFEAQCAIVDTLRDKASIYIKKLVDQRWDEQQATEIVHQRVLAVAIKEILNSFVTTQNERQPY